MASRFFVASSSDYDEEEEQQQQKEEEELEEKEENQEEAKENKQKSNVAKFFDDSWKSSEKRVVRSEKQKRWAELEFAINKVLDELTYANFKTSFEEFQSLMKLHSKSQKAIKQHGYPNFFIRGASDIQQQVKDLLPDNKDLRRFAQELEKFVVPFQDKLNEFAEHPENFQDEEEEEDEFQQDDDDDFEDDADADEGPGKWFIKSDDDNEEKNSDDDEDKDDKKEKRKNNNKSEVDYAEMIEQRLMASKNEVITDQTAREELDKDKLSRSKGKVITDTERLSILLHRVEDEKLKNDIQLEICFTIMQGSSEKAIPLTDWRLVLNILPKFRKPEEAEMLTPLFERLSRDFWARSVDPRTTFNPETNQLHQLQAEFNTSLTRFCDLLEADKKYAFVIRLQIIMLENCYHELAPSFEDRIARRARMSAAEVAAEETNQKEGLRARTPRELLRSILLKLSEDEGMFDANTTLSLKVRASLYYAIHLAYNGHPRQAQQLVGVLPDIPPELPFVRILNNRAFAEIGIAAFMTGDYRTAYNSLKGFTKNPVASNAILGQHPRIYAPWLNIDPAALEAYHYISAMMLDIPALTTFNYDDQVLLINGKTHKELQKKVGITACPESILDKIAVAIERCKRGEWQLARETLKYEIERYIPDPRLFERDLKLMSLCSYLLTANQYYDAVEIKTLKKQFDLEYEIDEKTKEKVNSRDVEDCLRMMHQGRSPVVNANIMFQAEFDNDYVKFALNEKETILGEYGRTLSTKGDMLQNDLILLEPTSNAY
ncbi:hypothetical protein TVAG_184380 [Trichomonas vaginalis G3]|uniref:Eukaryotic translation initiation factor 3 subunit C N-terminal domain-containing protein n=1 Tax=Trichomonas vaginalis (strain ATCC PRA-98 / G3) TaxID=412133 RepID=A2E9X4_TRIV3|nr:eukaryotic translation initiation factor 3 subunit C [Trichomonas vaginalis G3]EAY10536.1 hypothetical protein TVAG_184380 [Trichomonas vaginalis G3]KAI5551948.1 eukaryotic translation initiation factor 3 subunit C [Trichomonas vaginalis G3]|eukprot:XP_001322759.1 hypothetical protein [Trichomonas vaginalis G3]